ncbi:hypothetical protein [Cellulomonas sp. P5_C5]
MVSPIRIAIDQRVSELIEIEHERIEKPRPGEAFRIGDGETWEVGYESAGVVTVETIDRGASNGLMIVTSDVSVLQIYLALQAAVGWRRAHDMEVLTYSRLATPTEYVVVRDGQGKAEVRHANGTVVARKLSVGNAEELAVALSYPLDAVVASIKHPTGDPIWSTVERSDTETPEQPDAVACSMPDQIAEIGAVIDSRSQAVLVTDGIDEELCAAVVAYYGRGRRPYPKIDPGAARACATRRPPDVLLALVESIAEDAGRVVVDWSTTTLADAGRLIAARARELHPGLSDNAAEAVAWAFTYENR